MARVELLPSVSEDLRRIISHLEQHEAGQIQERLGEIVSASDVLTDNPLIGRPTGEGLRELEFEALAVRLMSREDAKDGPEPTDAEAQQELRGLLDRMLVERLKAQETEAIEAAQTDPAALARYRELQARRLELEAQGRKAAAEQNR